MFGLGLDDFARLRTPQPRNSLRHWSYAVDHVGSTQDILTRSGTNLTGPDISVITSSQFAHDLFIDVKWHEKTNDLYLRSGPFDVFGPGPFFDQINTIQWPDNTDYYCPWSGAQRISTKVYGSSFETWPFTETGLRLHPLVGEGFLTNNIEDKANCSDPHMFCELQPDNTFVKTNVAYSNCFNHVIDIKDGSSGGAILKPDCARDSNDILTIFDDLLVTYGVVHGSRQRTANSGLERIWFDPGHTGPGAGQGTPIESTVDMARADFGTISSDCSGEVGCGLEAIAGPINSGSKLTKRATEWASRDKDYRASNGQGAINPFDPVPTQPASDGCPGEMVEGVCHANIYRSTSGPDGYDRILPPLAPVRLPRPEERNDELGDVIEGIKDEGYQALLCFTNAKKPDNKVLVETPLGANWRFGASMMQGVLGSINSVEDIDVERYRVEAFTPVCTPWSSDNWLKNWRYVVVFMSNTTSLLRKTRTMRGGVGVGGTFGYLHEVLSHMFEIRKNIGEETSSYVRPPSMKNCPPNYYLWKVHYYRATGSGELAGINSVVCRLYKGAHEKFNMIEDGEELRDKTEAECDNSGCLEQDLRLYLSPSEMPNAAEFFGFEMDWQTTPDQSFSLEQRIGTPVGGSGLKASYSQCIDPQNSSKAGVAMGFIIRRAPSGAINHFELICGDAPAGDLP